MLTLSKLGPILHRIRCESLEDFVKSEFNFYLIHKCKKLRPLYMSTLYISLKKILTLT